MGDFRFNLLDYSGDNLDFFNYMVSNYLYPLNCVLKFLVNLRRQLIMFLWDVVI